MGTAVKKKSSALDKIIVKRPTPPPEPLQGAPLSPPTEVNPEFEQKPLAELNLQTSEDMHGGSEQTFSMPSPQGRGEAQQQESAGQSQELGRQQGAWKQSSAAAQQSSAQQPGGQPHGQQKPAAQSAEGGGASAGEGAGQQTAAARQSSDAAHRGVQQKFGSKEAEGGAQQQEGGGAQRQQGAGQQPEAAPQQGAAQLHDAALQQERAESQQQYDSWKQYYISKLEKRDAGERGDVRELGRDVKTGGSGSHMGVGGYNTAQVVDVKSEGFRRPDLRRLQTEFYRVLEMLAEEKTKHFDPSLVGNLVKAEYNVKKMAMRRYEGKPPTRYKAPRIREAVVLVLDNSGSMTSWADMLTAMSELAAKRRDVEVYLAPNGYVEEQIAPVKRKVKHDEFMKKMSGRKIIYVGDFDGTNTPVELSWRNDVIWIAPEDRYRRFLSHSWVKYDESKYKGAFVRTFTIDGIMKALKKVLGGDKWIDTCVKCKEDE